MWREFGDEVVLKIGKDDFGDCFNFGFGLLICVVKISLKFYINNFCISIVEWLK